LAPDSDLNQSSPPLRVVALYDGALPEHLERLFTEASTEPALHTLARALASGPGWRGSRGATFVVRTRPTPVLAALGRFDAEDEGRLQALRHHLSTVLPRTIYLDHRAAEVACERLAERFQECFGDDEIATMRFVGIPRGGMIVLGMLAYALRLKRRQLEPVPRDETDGPVVLVDDSLVGGARIVPRLTQHGPGGVIVATLYSHPELRAALRRHDPRITEVLSAHDLHDHAPQALGADYEAWRTRWEGLSSAEDLWIGQADHVCFPWSEPATSMWNPVTHSVEPGWRIIPPELCLASRHDPGSNTLTVQRQSQGRGVHRPAAHVVFGDVEGNIVIGHLESLQAFVLRGIAADMWRALIASTDEQGVVDDVTSRYDIDPATVRDDTRSFIGELLAAGIVEPVHA
jgi:hypothetical protein